MKCPVCEEKELRSSDRDGITVVHCPHCRGVWLSRDELDKIIARADEEETEESRRPPEMIERHREQRRRHMAGQRRDSTRLVENLFDF